MGVGNICPRQRDGIGKATLINRHPLSQQPEQALWAYITSFVSLMLIADILICLYVFKYDNISSISVKEFVKIALNHLDSAMVAIFFLISLVMSLIGISIGYKVKKSLSKKQVKQQGGCVFNKKNISIIFASCAALFLLIFLLTEKGSWISKEKDGRAVSQQKKRVEFIVANRETKLNMKKSAKESTEENEALQRWVSSDNEIKKTAKEFVIELYKTFDDMDFSSVVVSEMVFVKNTQPEDKSPGYYVVVLRNLENEIIARAVLNLIEEKGDKKLVEAGNVEPFPPAFTDPKTQREFREAEKYPLTDSFPLISKEEAEKLAIQKLGTNYSYQGLTNLFIFLPSLNNYYQIGVPFTPYYEFRIADYDEKTIWINSESGVIIDYDHLNSEAQEFEEAMAKD